MDDKDKAAFEKGRAYERVRAEQLAQEKSEAIVICLLERLFREQEGEVVIPNLDLMLSKRRYVVFQKEDRKNDAVVIKLVKELV